MSYAEDYALLQEWGVIHQKTVTWRPRPDLTCTATSEKRQTAQEAVKEAWAAALEWGYKPPRWFEWWRWREERAPKS